MPAQDDPIRMKILRELRSLQLKKSEDPGLERRVINIGSMAEGSGYEPGVIYRICTEMEEEGLIKWTRKKTMGGDRAQLKRSFDITLPGRQFLDSIVQGESGTADGNDRAVGYPGAYDSAYDAASAANTTDSNRAKRHVVSYQTVILNSALLIAQIEAFKSEARQSNELGEHKDDLLDFLDRFKLSIEELIVAIQEDDITQDEVFIKSWLKKFGNGFSGEFSKFTDPENAGKAAAAPGFILAVSTLFSAIGSIGGPWGAAGGFSAGVVIGKIFTNSAKGDEAAKKVESALYIEKENEPESKS